MDKKTHKISFIPRIINGGIAGIVGVTCVFPIDLVKTRLQNQQIGPNGEKAYKSLLDCFSKTFKSEGFFGMYKGAGVNILLITPEKAIKLVVNDVLRYRLRSPSGALPLGREMLAGAGAATCQIVVTTPMELLKIQLQDAGRMSIGAPQTATSKGQLAAADGGRPLQPQPQPQPQSQQPLQSQRRPPQSQTGAGAGAGQQLSARSIAMKLVRERGIFGLYRGLGSTFLRDVWFSAIYFPLFARLNTLGKRLTGQTTEVFYVSFAAGLSAGAFASWIATPFDVVKTRLQLINRRATEVKYDGIVDCFSKTWKNEGSKAFFKGGLCRMLVMAPLFGIAQTVYYLGVAERLLGYSRQGQV